MMIASVVWIWTGTTQNTVFKAYLTTTLEKQSHFLFFAELEIYIYKKRFYPIEIPAIPYIGNVNTLVRQYFLH